MLFQERKWAYWAHLTLGTHNYYRGKKIFLLLNEEVDSGSAHMGYHLKAEL